MLCNYQVVVYGFVDIFVPFSRGKNLLSDGLKKASG